MRRGWEVALKDGKILNEETTAWKDVPKNQIESLSLLYDGRRWSVSNKDAYFIRNTASMVPGVESSIRVEKRCIGYYEGSSKVFYSIEEATGKFNMHVEG